MATIGWRGENQEAGQTQKKKCMVGRRRRMVDGVSWGKNFERDQRWGRGNGRVKRASTCRSCVAKPAKPSFKDSLYRLHFLLQK